MQHNNSNVSTAKRLSQQLKDKYMAPFSQWIFMDTYYEIWDLNYGKYIVYTYIRFILDNCIYNCIYFLLQCHITLYTVYFFLLFSVVFFPMIS